MSQRKRRHENRRPIEEAVRVAIADLVGNAGQVDVERHRYDWRADDLLVWVRLTAPAEGSALEMLEQRLAVRMRELLPVGQALHAWTVVAEHGGTTVFRTAWEAQRQRGAPEDEV